jgi:hypothetical protein
VLEEPGDWAQLSARLRTELLGTTATTAVVAAPPVLEDPEVVAATQAADSWLVCVALGRTSSEEAERLKSAIGEGSKGPAGLVTVPAGDPD